METGLDSHTAVHIHHLRESKKGICSLWENSCFSQVSPMDLTKVFCYCRGRQSTAQTQLSSLLKGSGAFYKVTQEAHTGIGSHQGKGNLRFREEIPAGL